LRLKDLYKPFLNCGDEERRIVIALYRKERFEAIANHSSTKRMIKRITFDSLGLTDEEIATAKLLGLKPKDIKALRDNQ